MAIQQQSPSKLTDLDRICRMSVFLNPDVQILFGGTQDHEAGIVPKGISAKCWIKGSFLTFVSAIFKTKKFFVFLFRQNAIFFFNRELQLKIWTGRKRKLRSDCTVDDSDSREVRQGRLCDYRFSLWLKNIIIFKGIAIIVICITWKFQIMSMVIISHWKQNLQNLSHTISQGDTLM